MLINLWYVAQWSKSLKHKPVRVKMLGQQFVLFRDNQLRAHCLADTCLHRGGSLGHGQIINNDIACPYHGWRYGSNGRCTFIPSEGADCKIPARARVDSYPVEEHYGMIWVFLGDISEVERYPIPPFPEYLDAKWKEVSADWLWQADTGRVVENGIDVAHTSFVHPMFGHSSTASMSKITHLAKYDGWATSSNEMYPPQPKGGIRRIIRKEKAKTIVHTSYYMAGQTVRIHIEANPKWHIIMFDANTPVDEYTTKTFAIQLRNFFTSRFFDRGSMRRLKKVLSEDTTIVEQTRPFYLADSLENEVSVKSDRFMSTYRHMRRMLIEQKGWQIDTDKLKRYADKQAFTIPSPSRRQAVAQGIEPVLSLVPLRYSSNSNTQTTNNAQFIDSAESTDTLELVLDDNHALNTAND